MLKSILQLLFCVVLLFVISPGTSFSQDKMTKSNLHSIFLTGGGYISLYDEIRHGPGILAGYQFNPAFHNNLFFRLDAGTDFLGINGSPNSNIYHLDTFFDVGYQISFHKNLGLKLFAGGGMVTSITQAALLAKTEIYAIPTINSGLAFSYRPAYNHSIEIGATYKMMFADKTMMSITPYVAYNIRLGKNPQVKNELGSEIKIKYIEFKPVFPALYKYYDKNEIGRIKFKNTSDKILKNVQVSFFIKRYMDVPKEASLIAILKPNQSATISLYCLFNEKIMELTEDTPLASKVSIVYEVKNTTQSCE